MPERIDNPTRDDWDDLSPGDKLVRENSGRAYEVIRHHPRNNFIKVTKTKGHGFMGIGPERLDDISHIIKTNNEKDSS